MTTSEVSSKLITNSFDVVFRVFLLVLLVGYFIVTSACPTHVMIFHSNSLFTSRKAETIRLHDAAIWPASSPCSGPHLMCTWHWHNWHTNLIWLNLKHPWWLPTRPTSTKWHGADTSCCRYLGFHTRKAEPRLHCAIFAMPQIAKKPWKKTWFSQSSQIEKGNIR